MKKTVDLLELNVEILHTHGATAREARVEGEETEYEP